MLALFLKLILAHLIGNFFLQSAKMVNSKENKKVRSPYLYIHCLLHVLLSCFFVAELSFWPYALIIGISHLVIDTLKLYIQKPKWRIVAFIVDQLLHLSVLAMVSIVYCQAYLSLDFAAILNTRMLLCTVCILFLTMPCSIFIKTAISSWAPQNLAEQSVNGSLQNAGKWIGNLERILVFVFIISGHWEAVGFLLAAKSIFRFGDLKSGEDRRLTEYVLIGTLLSFGIAILIGIVYTGLL